MRVWAEGGVAGVVTDLDEFCMFKRVEDRAAENLDGDGLFQEQASWPDFFWRSRGGGAVAGEQYSRQIGAPARAAAGEV